MDGSEFKKDLIQDMRQMQEEMDLLFNQLSNWRKGPSSNQLWRPLTDVWENDDRVVVVIELAGVKPDGVSISLQNSVLTVRGERPPMPTSEECCFRNMEIATGRFERNIYLPDTIDANQVNARFNEGFLQITIGKRQAAPGAVREIEITEG